MSARGSRGPGFGRTGRFLPWEAGRTWRRMSAALVLAGLAWAQSVTGARGATVESVCAQLRRQPGDASLLSLLRQTMADVKDESRRTECMAAFSLGCLYAGRVDEGERTRAFLLERFPSHPAVARLKPDRLSAPCAGCGGTGGSVVGCAACQGSGACGSCKGSGTRVVAGFKGPGSDGTRGVRCTVCSGTGKCRVCKGAANAPGACKDCAGRGSKTVPASVEREYLDLLGAISGQGGEDGTRGSQPPALANPEKTPPRQTLAGMSEYVVPVQSLRRMYQAGEKSEVDLLDVLPRQESFAGRILVVKGFLLAHHQKSVKLAAESDPNSPLTLVLTPDTINVGTDAAWALQVEGNPVPVRATFGFLPDGRGLLFALQIDRPNATP